MRIEHHISKDQEVRVVEAIRLAELNTSGEIKVHLDQYCKGDALKRARELFGKMGLHQTKQRNAVLIFVALDDHKAAIFGDEGIHTQLDPDYWSAEMDVMIAHFKKGDIAGGLIQVVTDIGQKLKELYPYDAKTDTNEVANEISR
jgi:uncharacterized membrane protein